MIEFVSTMHAVIPDSVSIPRPTQYANTVGSTTLLAGIRAGGISLKKHKVMTRASKDRVFVAFPVACSRQPVAM